MNTRCAWWSNTSGSYVFAFFTGAECETISESRYIQPDSKMLFLAMSRSARHRTPNAWVYGIAIAPGERPIGSTASFQSGIWRCEEYTELKINFLKPALKLSEVWAASDESQHSVVPSFSGLLDVGVR